MPCQRISGFILAVALLICINLSAQFEGAYDGNSLIGYLGKKAGDNELANLKLHYKCEMANEAHYLSRAGIELILLKGVLNEIHLYKHSDVYGSYKGALPGNLKFGMSSGEVKRQLGKPLVSYNSGYCEFELQACIVSCWFDGGVLSQAGISLKTEQ